MITNIAATALKASGIAAQSAPATQEQGASGFADVLEKALGSIEERQVNSTDLISAFLRGEDVELHQVMAAAEEAGLALEMLVEMRNKLVDAYRTIVSMQV